MRWPSTTGRIAVTAKLNETTWGGKAIGSLKSYTTGLYAVTTAQERAQMTAIQLDAAQRTQLGRDGRPVPRRSAVWRSP